MPTQPNAHTTKYPHNQMPTQPDAHTTKYPHNHNATHILQKGGTSETSPFYETTITTTHILISLHRKKKRIEHQLS